MNKLFKQHEIKEDLIDILDWFEGSYSELHNETFNTTFYIIGRRKAQEALNVYGTYTAIGRIVSYDLDNFGELISDLEEPEEVANKLYYVLAEEYMNNHQTFKSLLDKHWNDEATDEINQLLIDALKTN